MFDIYGPCGKSKEAKEIYGSIIESHDFVSNQEKINHTLRVAEASQKIALIYEREENVPKQLEALERSVSAYRELIEAPLVKKMMPEKVKTYRCDMADALARAAKIYQAQGNTSKYEDASHEAQTIEEREGGCHSVKLGRK